MDFVPTFIDEDRDRSVGTCIGHMLWHFFHDEWITNHEAEHSGLVMARSFAYDRAVIEFHEQHKARTTYRFQHSAFQFSHRLRLMRRFPELLDIRMSDRSIQSGDNLIKGFRGSQAEMFNFYSSDRWFPLDSLPRQFHSYPS